METPLLSHAVVLETVCSISDRCELSSCIRRTTVPALLRVIHDSMSTGLRGTTAGDYNEVRTKGPTNFVRRGGRCIVDRDPAHWGSTCSVLGQREDNQRYIIGYEAIHLVLLLGLSAAAGRLGRGLLALLVGADRGNLVIVLLEDVFCSTSGEAAYGSMESYQCRARSVRSCPCSRCG